MQTFANRKQEAKSHLTRPGITANQSSYSTEIRPDGGNAGTDRTEQGRRGEGLLTDGKEILADDNWRNKTKTGWHDRGPFTF